MTWIFDQPAWIIVCGMILAAIFGMLWANTGKNYWLIALGGTIALTVALLITERLVETDSEALRRTIHQIAQDVEQNDQTALFSHIHSQATALRQKANGELPRYDFTDCTVTKVYKVEVTGAVPPRQATVEFMVRAEGDFQIGSDALGGKFLRYITLQFAQEDDGTWKVTDYSHSEPTQAWMNQEPGKQSFNDQP